MLFEGDRMARLVSEIAEGTVDPDESPLADRVHDLRFQAELVQYRKLLRAIRSLEDDVVEPDPELVEQVLELIEEEGERGTLRTRIASRRAAYVGGAIAAASLGGALVLVRRRRAA